MVHGYKMNGYNIVLDSCSGTIHVVDEPVYDVIAMFQDNHHLTIEEICRAFAQFNENYVCEEMQPGTDFDYVLYFPEGKPDAWYYCIHMEMGHTIYHRFTEEDYKLLIQN